MTVAPELIRTLADQEAVRQGYVYDDALPNQIIDWLQTNIIQGQHKWYGKPLVLLDWQTSLIRRLYGWHHETTGVLRFKRAICISPKKVGKTQLCAGLLLWSTASNHGRVQTQAIASTVQQGRYLYDAASDAVRLGPLKDQFWVRNSINTIEHGQTRSTLKVLSFTPQVSGSASLLTVADEFCEWPQIHAETIYGRLAYSGASNDNSLIIFISTPQYDRESLGYSLFSEARDIDLGLNLDIHTLSELHYLEDDAQCLCGEHEFAWQCPAQWRRVNPSLGVTVPEQYYHDQLKNTVNNPRAQFDFRTMLCAQWCGHSEQWIASDVWAKCYEPFSESGFYGCDIVIGADWARRFDLGAYVAIVKKDDLYYLLPRFFLPKEQAVLQQKATGVPYLRYAEQGYIHLTDSPVVDPQAFLDAVREDAKHFNIFEVRYDPKMFEEIRQKLEGDGILTTEVSPHATTMAQPTSYFEKLVIENKIRHNNNPLLNLCIQQATTKVASNDQILLDKRKSGKIDGLSAAIIGMSYHLAAEDYSGFSCGLV